MPHEVADQSTILVHLARAAAVGDARRLHDGRVVAHVVDHAHEAVVEHRQDVEENVLERWHGRPPRLVHERARGCDLVARLIRDVRDPVQDSSSTPQSD